MIKAFQIVMAHASWKWGMEQAFNYGPDETSVTLLKESLSFVENNSCRNDLFNMHWALDKERLTVASDGIERAQNPKAKL